MHRYYFDLDYFDDHLTDLEGTILDNLFSAEAEARDAILDLAAESLKTRKAFRLVSIEIRADDQYLSRVTVSDALGQLMPLANFKFDWQYYFRLQS
ncbi:DUF6894 family protein [Rhizobium sp. YIM 134829]|uniref:DUF6894 family protein n=1 Tax=Rhizobium sp. YIM 134829 TaxID=3390453 RepID=UPI00397A9F98